MKIAVPGATSIDAMNKKQKSLDGEQIGVTEHDVARITALFQKRREHLERYIRSRLRGSAEEAKELAQESYMRLLNSKKRRKVDNWEALLFCAARNLVTNRIEQRRIRRETLLDIEIEDHRTPEASWTKEHREVMIQLAISELPQRSREVVRLYLEGETYRQMAKQLGVNERTCRRDIEQAILEIRQKIGTDWDDTHE